MDSSTSIVTSSTTSLSPSPTPSTSSLPAAPQIPELHALHPVVSFIIGFGIILGASILNAAGLNFTKLDHVRNASLPRAARKRDWLRPLWLVGMLLYILSQLIGSTLALEYMRAEYVAPLGSSSLIFNFIFANMLCGTQITRTDIYGTVTVIIGVIGIVSFGSINSGLETEMDLARLKSLWSRLGWLFYFLLMAASLTLLFISASQLEAILHARDDLSAVPFAAENLPPLPGANIFVRTRARITFYIGRLRELLEQWTAAWHDKQLAWTLGIAWGSCGGGLAGGTLVFAKASVKLISGNMNNQRGGGQFLHPASIVTFILLGLTAVLQIICLNRGLKVYDSTLVVPQFYAIYTASGFLDSLVFNNEVDAYRKWTLVFVFFSIVVLIGGVVLLTSEKPAAAPKPQEGPVVAPTTRRRSARGKGFVLLPENAADEPESEVVWTVGDGSDDEGADAEPGSAGDIEMAEKGVNARAGAELASGSSRTLDDAGTRERNRLIDAHDDDGDEPAHAQEHDDFGDWEDGRPGPGDLPR